MLRYRGNFNFRNIKRRFATLIITVSIRFLNIASKFHVLEIKMLQFKKLRRPELSIQS